MRFTRRLFRTLLATSVAALAVAACSSSGGDSSAAGSSASSPAGTAKGTPITVGMICDCSGTFGITAVPIADVVKAWVNYENASGGLSGHPIQFTLDDDAGNPGTSLTAVKALIAAHIDVIVDGSSIDSAWASAAAAAKIPVVGAQSNTESFLTSQDFFPSGQTVDSITESVVATAKAAGATSVGLLYCAEAVQCQEGVPVIKSEASALGIADTYSGSIAAAAPNYTAQCLAARQDKVQGLIVLQTPPVAVRVGQNCATQGYSPTYITEGTGFSEQEGTAPGFTDSLWSPYPILPYWSDAPQVKLFRDVIDKYYPGLRSQTVAWSEAAAQGWTAGLLIRDAVKASGLTPDDAVSAAAVLTGLNSISGDTLDGWSPPLTFTPGQPHKVDCWFTGHIDHGTRSLVNGGRLTCESGTTS